METKIGKELSAELKIDAERVSLHSDSLIAMFWIGKAKGQLTIYVSYIIKKIQKEDFKVYHTSSNTKTAEFLTKIKPASTYRYNPLEERKK